MYKENLKLLVKGLKTLTPKQFDMGEFMTSCGTVGCVVGWAATFEGLEPVDDDCGRYSDKLIYTKYSERVFNVESYEWNWCFGDWVYIDNSIDGAIKRINYLVDNDGVPENFKNAYEFKDEYNKMFYSKGGN